MSTPAFSPASRMDTVLAELRAVADTYDAAALEAVAQAADQARRVFFSGQGRSGLMNRAIAIRLMHIGLTVHVAGEPSTPAIGPGDLLIAVSSSAKTEATLAHIAVARKAGAQVVLVSAVASAARLADVALLIPAKTAVASDQHAGSLFEQSLLLVGDALAWSLQQRRGVPDQVLNERHANLQ